VYWYSFFSEYIYSSFDAHYLFIDENSMLKAAFHPFLPIDFTYKYA